MELTQYEVEDESETKAVFSSLLTTEETDRRRRQGLLHFSVSFRNVLLLLLLSFLFKNLIINRQRLGTCQRGPFLLLRLY